MNGIPCPPFDWPTGIPWAAKECGHWLTRNKSVCLNWTEFKLLRNLISEWLAGLFLPHLLLIKKKQGLAGRLANRIRPPSRPPSLCFFYFSNIHLFKTKTGGAWRHIKSSDIGKTKQFCVSAFNRRKASQVLEPLTQLARTHGQQPEWKEWLAASRQTSSFFTWTWAKEEEKYL